MSPIGPASLKALMLTGLAISKSALRELSDLGQHAVSRQLMWTRLRKQPHEGIHTLQKLLTLSNTPRRHAHLQCNEDHESFQGGYHLMDINNKHVAKRTSTKTESNGGAQTARCSCGNRISWPWHTVVRNNFIPAASRETDANVSRSAWESENMASSPCAWPATAS